MSDPITIPAAPPAPDVPEASRRRRRAGLIAGAAAVVLAVVAATFAVVSIRGGEEAEAQPLALAFAPGSSESYEIHQTIDGQISSALVGGDQPITMDLTQVVTWTVTEVAEDGTATIEMTVDETSGTVDGVPLPSDQADVPRIEFVVAPDGEIVSAGGLALGGAGQMQGFGFPGMGQLTPILPEDGAPVAPGDTWERSFSQDFPFGDGTISYTAESRYARNDAVGDRDAAVIVTDLTVPLDFTLNLAELLDALGEDGPTGATGLAELIDASMSYRGEGSFTQTSFVDLEAQELLKTDSSGSFDVTVGLSGIPGYEGDIGFTGSFSQQLTRR